MEKTFWEIKITFKEKLKMFELQKVVISQKKLVAWEIDDMELCFILFGVYCLTINGELKTWDDAVDWMKNLDDLSVFAWIQEHIINNLQETVELQKKKTTENTNSKS